MPETNNTTNNNNEPGTGGGGETPSQEVTFTDWLEQQPEDVRGLIGSHTSGLKSALDSERSQRKELAKALKDVTKELDEGTQARESLEALTGKMEQYEQQIGAYDALSAAGVTNLRLAWIAAREAGAIDKKGNVNLETLKAEYPELFKAQRTPPGNAGAGAGQQPPQATGGMDALIRKKAGIS